VSPAGEGVPEAILAALAADDGVAILPTDTIPGLHARLDRPRALERLAHLKQRRPDQPFLLLIADLGQLVHITAAIDEAVSRYLTKIWPGPFTVILVGRDELPAPVRTDHGTVAVRLPADPSLRDLLSRTGPLASTSVNRTGQPPARDLAAAAVAFGDLPCWTDASGTATGAASALLDLTSRPPRLLRPGPVEPPGWDELLS
jgi:tRNA threonylcarbamoyl adenosine modification protein (Sua5/YciO/YrdC/YwlC family)